MRRFSVKYYTYVLNFQAFKLLLDKIKLFTNTIIKTHQIYNHMHSNRTFKITPPPINKIINNIQSN